MSWLASFLLNPAMLAIGTLAIASPIIIHLLNKRRFRIVDWAAMDFLFDADKKNRRRVKLENFILLLLRCLAMLLLGLWLARPFLPSELAGKFGQTQEFKRFMLLDDSLSQQVLIGNRPAFDDAKDRIKQMLQMFARDQNSDYFTLFLTSQPDKPVLVNEAITGDSVDSLIQRIDELRCSDQIAKYDESLSEIRSFVEGDRSTANPVVYVLTDLRERDWRNPASAESENAPHKILADISQTVPNTFLVDVGSSLEENLAVTEISSEDLLVANAIVRFKIAVTNFGVRTADDIEVRFRVNDLQPQTVTVASVAPGETETVTIPYLFQMDVEEFATLDFQEQLDQIRVNYRVVAEIVQDGRIRDHLIQDSTSYFAARTLKGLPILIVDGEPSAAIPERGESYYLQAVGLPGTGLLVDVTTVGQFEYVSLSKYKTIFLLNVDEASPDRVRSLRQWVEDGGGLVLMPGVRVRGSTFNETFYKDGTGLSPFELVGIDGDVNKNDWVFMEVADAQHPALRVTQEDDVGMGKVEVFSWWNAKVQEDQLNSIVSVPIRLSNQDHTPAMAEKSIGDGRVVAFSFPADADWTMWPGHPTYICVMWDLVNYLIGNDSGTGKTRVGGSLREIVDLSVFDLRVSLTDPQEEKIESTAKPLDQSEESKQSVLYQVGFDELPHRGFYQMSFRKRDNSEVPVLFAANVDPGEGDLRRIDVSQLPNGFFGTDTKILTADQMTLTNEARTSNEIWPQILLLLACLLGLEQFLGWWFGRKR